MAAGFKLTLALIVSAVFCAAVVNGLSCMKCKISPVTPEQSEPCSSVKCGDGQVCKRTTTKLEGKVVFEELGCEQKLSDGDNCTTKEPLASDKVKIFSTTCTCSDKDDCNKIVKIESENSGKGTENTSGKDKENSSVKDKENSTVKDKENSSGKDKENSSGKLLGWSTLTLCTISSIFTIFSQVVFMGGQ